uniref:hypothetical protein n=1 Tax=Marinobacterium profundum TaxID=1714300 RepID=UPI000A74213A|nr:hypothetical protein [Marinobacterium profundum]
MFRTLYRTASLLPAHYIQSSIHSPNRIRNPAPPDTAWHSKLIAAPGDCQIMSSTAH